MMITLTQRIRLARAVLMTVLVGGGVLLPFAYTFAQDGIGVRLQPSILDERADPGATIEGVLTVTNEDGGPQHYFLATRNIDGMDDSGRPHFSETPASDPLEAASWITLSTDGVDLEQGASIDVPYRITVPADASPGSYFAAIFVTREAENPVESGAGVGFQVASLLNLRVNGAAIESMLIREFSTSRALYTQPAVTFNARLENTGTVHERPVGIITVSNMFGREVGQARINENAGGILPRTDRTFEVQWNTDAFSIGRYTALVSIVFGDMEKQTITHETSFWIVPLKEVGMVLGGILLLGVGLTWGMRRYVRRALVRAGHGGALERSAVSMSFARRLVRTLAWLMALLSVMFIGVLVFFA